VIYDLMLQPGIGWCVAGGALVDGWGDGVHSLFAKVPPNGAASAHCVFVFSCFSCVSCTVLGVGAGWFSSRSHEASSHRLLNS
jgi:hypothetical protein